MGAAAVPSRRRCTASDGDKAGPTNRDSTFRLPARYVHILWCRWRKRILRFVQPICNSRWNRRAGDARCNTWCSRPELVTKVSPVPPRRLLRRPACLRPRRHGLDRPLRRRVRHPAFPKSVSRLHVGGGPALRARGLFRGPQLGRWRVTFCAAGRRVIALVRVTAVANCANRSSFCHGHCIFRHCFGRRRRAQTAVLRLGLGLLAPEALTLHWWHRCEWFQ